MALGSPPAPARSCSPASVTPTRRCCSISAGSCADQPSAARATSSACAASPVARAETSPPWSDVAPCSGPRWRAGSLAALRSCGWTRLASRQRQERRSALPRHDPERSGGNHAPVRGQAGCAKAHRGVPNQVPALGCCDLDAHPSFTARAGATPQTGTRLCVVPGTLSGSDPGQPHQAWLSGPEAGSGHEPEHGSSVSHAAGVDRDSRKIRLLDAKGGLDQ